ncbi:leucine-rich repeat-containing protein 75B-like [Glandiceps talaboti]
MSFFKKLFNINNSPSTIVEEISIGKKSEFNQYPHRRRVMLVNEVRELGQQEKVQEMRAALKALRKDMGIDGDETASTINSGYGFVIDPESVEIIVRISNIQPMTDEKWKQELTRLCDQLIAHLSPSTTKSRTILSSKDTDHTELLLMNIDFSKHGSKKDFEKIQVFLDRNEDLKTIDLSYTGLSNEQLKDLLPNLAKLKSLNFLGLQGNRLDEDCVQTIIGYLKLPTNFPELKLVDFKNNELCTLQKSFLVLIQQRWGKQLAAIPTLGDLASGRAMLEEDLE